MTRASANEGGLLVWPAFLAVMIWSGLAPVTKPALASFPVLAFTALRPAIAALLIFAILRARRIPLGIDGADLPRLLAGSGALALSQLSYVGGLHRTSVSHAAILLSSSPLVAAGWRLLAGRRPTSRALMGVAAGFGGVLLLVLGAGGTGGATMLGDAIIFAGAVTWMGATAWPARLLPKYGALKLSGWLFLTSLIVMLPLGLLDLPLVVRQTPPAGAWAALVYAAIIGNLLGNTLWQRAVATAGAASTLPYLYLEPVGSLLLAAAFLGERLSLIQGVGGALAIAGVILVPKR